MTTEELLQRHLRRAYPQSSAFARKVRVLQAEYVPPFDTSIGWDTRFQPRQNKRAYYPIPVVWFTVNVMSSLLGMRPPILSMEPKTADDGDREQAAKAELLLKFESERQEIDLTHLELAKVLSLKGRAGLKLGYGPGDELWTENIDAIENLWPEFENNSYKRIRSWSYHSLISPDEAKDLWGWKGDTGGGFWSDVKAKFQSASHANPLGRGNPVNDVPSFDGVPMVDFHWRDAQGRVMNAIYIGAQQVEEKDTKLKSWPYLTINCEEEPDNPFGIGDAEPVIGIQKEVATRKTAWAEAIRRNGLDQWVTYGVRGLSPKEIDGGGRYFTLGSKDDEGIEPLKFPIDDLGFKAYLDDVWDDYRKITGIPPEVLGGGQIAAGTSGYAMAVKFQAVITRIGPRQRRLKAFYRRWGKATLQNIELVNPEAKAVIDGNYFTNVDFEDITPKDFAQTVTTYATAVQANLLSRRTAMEDMNKVSEDEMRYISEWNSNPALSPQTAAAIQAMMGQMQALLQGSPQAAAGAEQQVANAAAPAQTGENQHTLPQGPAREPMTSPVTQNPPNA